MIRHAQEIKDFSEPIKKEIRNLRLEKRKCARASIHVPVAWVSLDSKDRSSGQTKGIVRNVSQTGLKIEAVKDVSSDRLRLAFVDLNQNVAKIYGKVVFSQKTASGTYKIGVQLQGNKADIIQFISRLVRFHYYTKNKKQID
jgi:hypothetical protein